MSAEAAGDGTQTLSLAGRLDVDSTGEIWRAALRQLQETRSFQLLVDASQVTYCDGAGVALLLALRRHQAEAGGECEVRGLAERFQHLLDLFASADLEAGGRATPEPRHVLEEIGQTSIKAGE